MEVLFHRHLGHQDHPSVQLVGHRTVETRYSGMKDVYKTKS
jgi:hypothetical protein